MTPADTLLVLRAQQGNRVALDAALQSIQRPLFGYIARLVALLLLISTVATYSIVILGLFALGAHVTRAVLRVLQAIEAR